MKKSRSVDVPRGSLPVALCAFVALLGAPAAVPAGDDQALETKIESELVRNRVTDHATIEVQSRGGVVTLSGEARSTQQKRLAGEIALRQPGVVAVENRLGVAAR
jgi:osmotically-inducible protein OsmY